MSPGVRAALERIGGAEDVRFSPSNGRIALACLPHNAIAIADVTVDVDGDRSRVTITHVEEYSSPSLDRPHGVDFVDDDTVIVANRGGNLTLLQLPADTSGSGEAAEIELPADRDFEGLSAPGSVRVVRDGGSSARVLVVNIWNSTITSHELQDEPWSVHTNDVLLRRWLDSPDGVATIPDGRWIAVSSHGSHVVLVYACSSSLGTDADPQCILRGVTYCHGVVFSADSRHLFVADAGRPYVHVYEQHGVTWEGVHVPSASFRVMNDDVFAKARDAQSGGPKGVDIDHTGRVLAVACENQPVKFFDVPELFEHAAEGSPDRSLEVEAELHAMEHARVRVDARIAKIMTSRSFRITKPLRQLNTIWAKRRG